MEMSGARAWKIPITKHLLSGLNKYDEVDWRTVQLSNEELKVKRLPENCFSFKKSNVSIPCNINCGQLLLI